jgi:exodeoxyribonuclease VII large subunit
MDDLILSVSDFVAVFNQTLEYAYPSVTIVGELSNLRISKGRWVYFDLKDDHSSVKFFGTAQQLPGPLEDGLLLQVRGVPRLHNQFGFSVNVQFMTPVGEGSIQKAASLLEVQLSKEGLFDEDRKRPIPKPPDSIGLITSGESAAYQDFIKILNARWGGVHVSLADVQVQGEPATGQIIRAIEHFNAHEKVDVLVLIRGGGSADDLAVFSSEQVTRAVAGSRTPTVVAIGHEIDISLAELAADLRASTPSNAAELLVPDRRHVASELKSTKDGLHHEIIGNIEYVRQQLLHSQDFLSQTVNAIVQSKHQWLTSTQALCEAFNPKSVISRGYAVVRTGGKVVSSVNDIEVAETMSVQLADGFFDSNVTKVEKVKG